MRRLVYAVLAAAALSPIGSTPRAAAQPTPAAAEKCIDFARLEAVAAGAGATVVHDLRGADAVNWLDAYNAIPPVTAIGGDQVVLVERATGPTVLVVVFTQGCATAAWEEGRGLVGRVTDGVLVGS